ncbi:MAG: endonuclease III, partial [Lentisphaerae bacterium]|nr:endonuclease III [Lentisphaerota bacterium]
LFRRCRVPSDYLRLPPGELENLLRPLGFFRQKTRLLRGTMQVLHNRHHGQVPGRMPDLLELPGVGRKTANVVLSNGFGVAAGIAVDTHVRRVARRLGWTVAVDPDRIEQDLLALFARRMWPRINHVLVIHGRYVCRARRPDCAGCRVRRRCPAASDSTQSHGAQGAEEVLR